MLSDALEGAPLVVCLPSMDDVRSVHRLLVPLLAARGLRVLLLDLPGHGDFGIPAEPAEQQLIGEAAVALVDRLGGPATVVAHSFTPDRALLATQLAPRSVVGAVAIAPWALAPAHSALMRAVTWLVTGSPLLWSLFYRSLNRTPPVDLAEHRRRIVASLRWRRSTETLRAMGAGATKHAGTARGSQAAPVVVVMDERDPDFRHPRPEAKSYADAVGAAVTGVRMIVAAGHYPRAEQPAETAESVLARRLGWHVDG